MVLAESLTAYHRNILSIILDECEGNGGGVHYSRVAALLNQRCGLLCEPPERQFKESGVNRRIVELRRRGYCELISSGRNRITVEGMEYLNNNGGR